MPEYPPETIINYQNIKKITFNETENPDPEDDSTTLVREIRGTYQQKGHPLNNKIIHVVVAFYCIDPKTHQELPCNKEKDAEIIEIMCWHKKMPNKKTFTPNDFTTSYYLPKKETTKKAKK